MQKNILITGAAGYVGSLLGARLAADFNIVGTDIRSRDDLPFAVQKMDVRDSAIQALMEREDITHVVHLASVLDASGDRARDYDIDVNGTRNVLISAVRAGVSHITVTSSGAAYGYHADNPAWIDEQDALRGNPEFPYSDHKRQIETMLAEFRQEYPQLKQLIFRPGTILGAHTRNLITDLFAKKRLLAIKGSDSPFVFIWDGDVIRAMEQGIREDVAGIYNMAGDGALTIHQIAAILGKPVLALPPGLIRSVLWLGKHLGIGRYGPEQVNFLRYRPVLSNRRLKEEFGYQPEKSSEQTFRYYVEHARARGDV
ncbi:NAD-dependent epimerase/dehydratase [Alcanivorax sp. S71-1-4]|uniref:SDR family oxidoreductase n=1 Tax=Alcanivorax sp. S71-1-4 TaxID=1177159 RepID=UPI00135AB71F|nr:SDR family oxidoreductase [Alcanivorax sp. S71-1-4]KAF0810803.1 NAD-dependent epimerase/dehydratase [Alcanivorax sp. S71-1-4]